MSMRNRKVGDKLIIIPPADEEAAVVFKEIQDLHGLKERIREINGD